MSSTWKDIQQDSLGDGAISTAPDDVVSAFNTVENVLGREHVDSYRSVAGDPGIGADPQRDRSGPRLQSLAGATNSPRLLEKLKAHDASAHAELTPIHLLRTGETELEIEIEPDAVVPSVPA
jgi:hypothetical protein